MRHTRTPLVFIAALTVLPVGIAMPTATAALSFPAVAPASATGSHHSSDDQIAWRSVASPGPGFLGGLVAVDERSAWVGSDDGGVWRTTNGGRTWKDVAPPDSAGLGFRRIVPLGTNSAVILARGAVDDPNTGSLAARIFRTDDGGRSWDLTFVNHDPAAFYGCLDMLADGRHGFALSDPPDGKFRLIATADGARTWHVLPNAAMPPAVDGEFSFATGKCLRTVGNRDVWFGSGGAAARIFHSGDRGRTWSVTSTGLPTDATNGAGVFGLDFRHGQHGIAVGGTFADITDGTDASAYTVDGQHWTTGGDTGGLRFTVAWLPLVHDSAVAVGFNGSDVTYDGGRNWTTFDTTPYAQVDCAPGGACWASGPDGAVARLTQG
jgi:photosystem II stability/assembly factor-like uncharacterized protein